MTSPNKKTSAFWKLADSVVNVTFIFIVSLPFLVIWDLTDIEYRLTVILLFLAYELVVTLTPQRRDFGDILIGSRWIRNYSLKNHLTFALLYTLSFSTLFIWIIFPFDLLLFNLLFVQLPFVVKTGYTLHGYLSGKMAGTRD